MNRQIASLTLLAGALMLACGYAAMEPAVIAQRLVAVHGVARAVDLAPQGTGPAMVSLIPAQLAWAGPYLVVGALAGLLARVAVYRWKRPLASAQKVVVVDEAGGRFAMYGVNFAHAPHAPKLPVADVTDVAGVDRASLIEEELLGAYRAGGQPADVVGYHGVSLFEHCHSVWRRAVQAHGDCSLESLLALAHDAGKMLTFTRGADGAWTRQSPRHEMYNAEAVRRLPSFWRLPAVERELVLRALHYMAGGVAAQDVPASVVTAVQRVRVLDVRTTAAETAEPRRAGFVDLSAVMGALVNIAANPPQDWNVNRSQSASTPAGAIYIGDGVLLVSGRAMRSALARELPAADAAALSLNAPSTDWHSAYELIAEGMRQAGVGTRIVRNVASESGWFTVRVGAAKMPYAIALKSSASPAQHEAWGTNNLEIVLTEARKPQT